MKQPKKLNHPRKAFITVQNIDYNKCFKWFLVRHLNPADHQLPRIRKAGKDIKFPVKIEALIKLKKRIPSALVFLIMKIKKNIQCMYRKNVVKKSMLIYY